MIELDDPTLRIEARFKNARLYEAIRERSIPSSQSKMAATSNQGGPVLQFCKFYKVSYETTLKLLNLKMNPLISPGGRRPRYHRICEQLATICDATVEELFPLDLYAVKWPAIATYVDHRRFVPLLAASKEQLALPPSQDENIAQQELREVIAKQLKTITPREERIVRKRFGLDEAAKSIQEVADEEGVSRERIRQIEAKALRKLRHRSRSKPLRAFAGLTKLVEDEPREATDTRRPQRLAANILSRSFETDQSFEEYQSGRYGRSLWRTIWDVPPDELSSLQWIYDEYIVTPRGCTEIEISRLYVPTRPYSEHKGITIIVEGYAVPPRGWSPYTP